MSAQVGDFQMGQGGRITCEIKYSQGKIKFAYRISIGGNSCYLKLSWIDNQILLQEEPAWHDEAITIDFGAENDFEEEN